MDNLKVLSIESDAHFTRDGVNTAQNLRFYLQAASKKTTGLDLLDLSGYAAYHEGRQHSGGVTAAQIVSEFLPRLSNIKTLICPITFFGSVENKEHLAILRSSVNPMVPLADEYLSDERNAHENMSCPQSIYNYADRRSGVRGLARRWVNRTI
jgi:hypothetical protein